MVGAKYADSGGRRRIGTTIQSGLMEEGQRAPASDLGAMSVRVRLGTLVTIRWAAVIGQLATLAIVRFGLGFPLPLAAAGLAVGASAALNLILQSLYPATHQLSDRQAASQLGFDLLQLAFLLFLTGGLTNPFSILIVVPVSISATVLSRRSTLILLVLGLALSMMLALWHRPLPWHGGGELSLPEIYVFGLWTGVAFSMVFLTLYAGRVSAEARRHALALAATKAALDREQKLAELGTLAAAAAHELGTPLGTITLAARDLLKETPDEDPRHEDVALINDQVGRCRQILEQLSKQRMEGEEHPFFRQPLSAILAEAVEPFERQADIEIAIHAENRTEDGGSEPILRRRPEILHALNNVIENAVAFARHRVEITLAWSDTQVEIAIRDDGPGFDAAILRSLGEPYIRGRRPTTRRGKADGMGLGVFIAKTLLERTGAAVSFSNAAQGGALVRIRWPRDILEADRKPMGTQDGTGKSDDR